MKEYPPAAEQIKRIALVHYNRNNKISTEDLVLKTSVSVLRTFFGQDWIKRHLSLENPATNFFIGTTKTNNGVSSSDMLLMRASYLAEMIVNMEKVPGIYGRLDKIKENDIEGMFAELDVARLIYLNKLTFKFVEPRLIRPFDYDYEIHYEGQTFCVETEGKSENTKRSKSTVLNSLNHAKMQLPRDRPGVIFVKIPQSWLKYGDLEATHKEVNRAASTFFNNKSGDTNTTHIVSIIFYYSVFEGVNGFLTPSQWAINSLNPHHKFPKNISSWFFEPYSKRKEHWVSINLIAREIAVNDKNKYKLDAQERLNSYNEKLMFKNKNYPLYVLSTSFLLKRGKRPPTWGDRPVAYKAIYPIK